MAKKKRKKAKKGPGSVERMAKQVKLLSQAEGRNRELRGLVVTKNLDLSKLNALRREQADKVDGLEKKVRALIDKQHEMYVEVYDLVRCLNATREKWYRAENKLKDNVKTWTVNVKAFGEDGVPLSDMGAPSDTNPKITDDPVFGRKIRDDAGEDLVIDGAAR